MNEIARSVASLEEKICLRLDAQTDVLDKQLDALQQIAEILRNPLRTRAAERVRAANELLRHHRNERALAVAEEAIKDDPNNHLAFIVAGWASFGLKLLERARGYFREARQSTARHGRDYVPDFDNLHAARLAARLTFALEGPEAALQELGEADRFDESNPSDLAQRRIHDYRTFPGARAFYYDQALYMAATKRTSEAISVFRTRCATKEFCYLALTDPVLMQNKEVAAEVRSQLSTLTSLVNRTKALLDVGDARVEELRALAKRHQINPDVYLGRIMWQLFDSQKREYLRQELDTMTGEALNNHIRWLTRDLEYVSQKIKYDPRIDRERAKESIFTEALKTMTSRSAVNLLFRGRVDAIISKGGGFFAIRYFYMVADHAKPLVCVRTYEMTLQGYERARSEIIRNDSSRGLDAPLLSPIISRRPKNLRSTNSWHWNKDSTSHAWPDDDQ